MEGIETGTESEQSREDSVNETKEETKEKRAENETIPDALYVKKTPEALGRQAFSYAIMIGGWGMAGLALLLILRNLLKKGSQKGESNTKISYFTIPDVLRIAAVFVSFAAALWVLFPRTGLPVWSALRCIIENIFYRKDFSYSEAAPIYGRGPGISAVTAGFLAAGIFYLAFELTDLVSKRIVRAAGERTGQKTRAICRFIQIILVLVLISLVLYFFGVSARVLGFAAIILIAAIGLGGNTVIGDMTAGLWILLAGILRVGDFVEVEGRKGQVDEIHLTYTVLVREDDDRIIVGNRLFAQKGLRILRPDL